MEPMWMAAVSTLTAMIVYSLTLSLLSARRHAAEIARMQKQIDAYMRHQQKLLLILKSKDGLDAELALSRHAATETDSVSVPAAAVPAIRVASDPVMVPDANKRMHKIRFIGLDPLTDDDAARRLVEGDEPNDSL